MATENVACPYCGKETMATVAKKSGVKGVKKKTRNAPSKYKTSTVGCPNGHTFAVYY